MLLLAISIFFCWLIFRELRRPKQIEPLDLKFIALMFTFAVLFAWSPVRYWLFERMLSDMAYQLSNNASADVHCNTAFDSIFDNAVRVAGHANPRTGRIVLQVPWCSTLMDYLDEPEGATHDEVFSLLLFVHEAMHIRGELNEKKTDCQALQRFALAAVLMNVPGNIARKHALVYYNTLYPRHPYYSEECVQGSALDENLWSSPWNLSS